MRVSKENLDVVMKYIYNKLTIAVVNQSPPFKVEPLFVSSVLNDIAGMSKEDICAALVCAYNCDLIDVGALSASQGWGFGCVTNIKRAGYDYLKCLEGDN